MEGITVFSQWGQLGGAVQDAREDGFVVNAGKKNEVSARDYALYLAREKCRKKHWEGYREVNGAGETLDEHVTTIDFSNPPPNLAFWKPESDPSAGMLKKAELRKTLYARKLNGLMYCAWSSPTGSVFLTSRRMLRQQDDEVNTQYTWNDRFPHIVEALSRVMPPKSCVLGELVAFDRSTNKDSLALIGSYTKSLTQRALEDQGKFGWAWYYVWDIAFWDGQDLISQSPVGTRYDLIAQTFKEAPFVPVQVFKPGQVPGFETPDQFKELAKQWGWEGFVMVDPEGIFGDRAYNFKGKPDRPGKFASKVKPVFEDDFVVYWDPEKGYGEYSTKGRYGGKGMKSACLYQYNKKGELVFIGNVGSGLTEEMKTNAHPSQFPQVWRVFYTWRRYVSEGDDTNALDFPRVDESQGIVHDDKKPEECVNPRL